MLTVFNIFCIVSAMVILPLMVLATLLTDEFDEPYDDDL